MPRIRKKTSNRQTTHDRRKIQQKVRESRKKARKAAKNNTQWKSKKPKDPGIPNNFPFKDQILAEVSEQRRQETAEKLRKKEERKALRAKTKLLADELTTGTAQSDQVEGNEDVGVELEELKGLQVGNDAVGGISAKHLVNAKALRQPKPTPVEAEANEEKVPVLINRDLSNLQAVLDVSDVVIEILDARDPLSFRSSHLEELVATKSGQRILFILNKIDMCPRESVAAWTAYLRSQQPTFMFQSATCFLPSNPDSVTKVKGKGKATMRAGDGLGVDSVLACLGEWASAKTGDEQLTVAVVGVANVGKSSFINSLVRSNVVTTYSLETSSLGPTTTELPQEVLLDVLGRKIRMIDTPGLSWHKDEGAENSHDLRVRDILLRSKGRIDRLKDPTSVVSHIVSRGNAEDLMLLYNLPAFPQGDPTSFLSGIARSHQLVKKRGALDLAGASRILLRDWSTGRLMRYTNPPKLPTITPTNGNDMVMPKLHEEDEMILGTLLCQKNLRKSAGLVKITSGHVDTRKVVLDQSWKQDHATRISEDDEQGEGGENQDISEASDVEDLEEESNEEGNESEQTEEAPLVRSRKQKRKRVIESSVAPVTKRVTFAPGPKPLERTHKTSSSANELKRSRKGPTSDMASMLVRKKQPKPATMVKPDRKGANSSGKSTSHAGTPSNSEAYNFGEFF